MFRQRKLLIKLGRCALHSRTGRLALGNREWTSRCMHSSTTLFQNKPQMSERVLEEIDPNSPEAQEAREQPQNTTGRVDQVPEVKVVNMDTALGIMNLIVLSLRHGLPGVMLDEIRTENSSVGVKWRKMTEAFLHSQFHVLMLFGYTPDEYGMKNYAEGLNRCVDGAKREADDVIAEYLVLSKNTWKVLLRKTFGVTEFYDIPASACSVLSMAMVEEVQKPNVMKQLETLYNEELKQLSDMTDQSDRLQDALIPHYIRAIEKAGKKLDMKELKGEKAFIFMQAAINSHGGDETLRKNVAMLSKVIKRVAPIQVQGDYF